MLLYWYETTAADFAFADAVGVLSIGSCEQDGDYLPVGTDGLIGWRLVQAAAERAESPVLLLPPQQVGYSPHHRAFPGCLTLSQETMFRYLLELCQCAFDNGLTRLLLVNSHGGNQSCLQTVVNELGARYDYRPLLVRYWDLIADTAAERRSSGSGGMGHAGEFETSVMQYLYPELVRPERFGQRPAAAGNRYHSPDLFARNAVYQYKPFQEYDRRGNVGQPQLASAEKGEAFFLAAADQLAKLIDFYRHNRF